MMASFLSAAAGPPIRWGAYWTCGHCERRGPAPVPDFVQVRSLPCLSLHQRERTDRDPTLPGAGIYLIPGLMDRGCDPVEVFSSERPDLGLGLVLPSMLSVSDLILSCPARIDAILLR